MPILPLDHPEPFAATLGVMLYPGTDNDDPLKARAFASHWLATPIQRYEKAGHKISRDVLLRIAIDGGHELDDLGKRWRGGIATGELFKTLWALFNTDRALATWNNAIKIAELQRREPDKRFPFIAVGGETSLSFGRPPLGSLGYPQCKFDTRPEQGHADFQLFLAEAEILRDFGQRWRPARANSEPLLPPDIWNVPENWRPAIRHPESAESPFLRCRRTCSRSSNRQVDPEKPAKPVQIFPDKFS